MNLLNKDLSDMSNGYSYEYILSLKDAEMAIIYVLDQVAPLESFLVSLIDYFTL